jgi:hypothetical protein
VIPWRPLHTLLGLILLISVEFCKCKWFWSQSSSMCSYTTVLLCVLVPLALTTLTCAIVHTNFITWLNSQTKVSITIHTCLTDVSLGSHMLDRCSHCAWIKMTSIWVLIHSFKVIMEIYHSFKAILLKANYPWKHTNRDGVHVCYRNIPEPSEFSWVKNKLLLRKPSF